MQIQEENLKVIFGLKLRQFREKQKFSTQELSEQSGLSASYINEIEKGKKYPKVDKIMSLATALNVDYDDLVSLKLGRQLDQLSELLSSNVLQEMPLDIFGIKTSDLIGLMGDDPAKFSALIQTLLEVARNYDVQVEHFLLAALRSYQELHNNYFEELEELAEDFLADHGWASLPTLHYGKLKELLIDEYNYEVIETDFSEQPRLQDFRSVFVPSSQKKLFINSHLKDSQKAFVLGHEIGYAILGIEDRALTSSWIEVESFEKVLNNFKASYFSGAILLNRNMLVKKLQSFFDQPRWEPAFFLSTMDAFDATPETFVHRLTQLLPHYFGLDQLFFLRFHNNVDNNQYKLTKELHLSRLHNPHRVNPHEHYCRRWVTINLLQKLARVRQQNDYENPLIDAQYSQFFGTENQYLCISIARPLSLDSGTNSCVTLGLQTNEQLKNTVRFWDDPAIQNRIVNESCERCGITDCQERVAEPWIYINGENIDRRQEDLDKFITHHAD